MLASLLAWGGVGKNTGLQSANVRKLIDKCRAPLQGNDVPTLVAKKKIAANANLEKLRTLTMPQYEYKNTVRVNEVRAAQKEELLKLRIGAPVIALCNFDEVTTGTTGTVTRFSQEGDTFFPFVKFDGIGEVLVVYRTDVRHTFMGVETEHRVPLRLAWYLTMHMALGCEFSRVHVDLSGCFAEGQGYVGVTRARSMEGLHLKGVNKKAFLHCQDALDRENGPVDRLPDVWFAPLFFEYAPEFMEHWEHWKHRFYASDLFKQLATSWHYYRVGAGELPMPNPPQNK